MPFPEETLLFPVCLWLLLGWCHYHGLCTARLNPSFCNTREWVQLLSHSRLVSDSTLEAQTLHKLPIKANLPNYIPLKATIVLIHDWTAQFSFQMKKKKSPGCIEQLPDISYTLRAFQYYWKAFECSTPERVMVIIFSNRTKSLWLMPAQYFYNLLKEIFHMY